MNNYISTILSIVVLFLIPALFLVSVIRNAKKTKKSGIAEKKK